MTELYASLDEECQEIASRVGEQVRAFREVLRSSIYGQLRYNFEDQSPRPIPSPPNQHSFVQPSIKKSKVKIKSKQKVQPKKKIVVAALHQIGRRMKLLKKRMKKRRKIPRHRRTPRKRKDPTLRRSFIPSIRS